MAINASCFEPFKKTIFPTLEHSCVSALQALLLCLYLAADHDLSLVMPLVSDDPKPRIPISIPTTPYCFSNTF